MKVKDASVGWVATTLGSAVTFQRGFDITKADQVDGAYPVISSSGPSSFHADYKVLGPGVIIGRKGSLGGVYFADGPYWPHDTTLWVRDFHGNDPRFVFYFLQTLGLAHFDVGASNPTLNRNHLHLLPITLPLLPTQRKIAAILSAYDDLIENNTRRIKLLEEMAQRTYREWFVDFRYPGHGDAPLVDSQLGAIPEGWRVARVKDLCRRVVDGDWIETKDQGGDAYRLLQVSNIGLGSFRETGNFRYISQATFERLRCTQVHVGFVLVSRMPEPIARAWFVDHLDIPAVTAVDVAILEPNTDVSSGRFLAFSLNTDRILAYAAARASGTTRARITRRDLETFPVLLPASPALHRFSEFLDAVGELQLSLTLQNRCLQQARDLLLPRLISGEIDVDNMAITVEEAAA